MWRYCWIACSILLLLYPLPSDATGPDHIVISQLQVAGATATDEWIELYNPTDAAIDISSYSFQYKSATGSTFQKKNAPSGATIAAHGYYLVSHADSAAAASANMSHSSFSISGTGGNIFLVNTQTTLPTTTDPSIVDHIGYGTGNAPEGTAVAAPASGQSLERKPGGGNGHGTDTNNNNEDFAITASPSPRSTQSPVQPPLSSSASSSDTLLKQNWFSDVTHRINGTLSQ